MNQSRSEFVAWLQGRGIFGEEERLIFTRSVLLVLLTGVLTTSAVCQKASPSDRVAGWATDIDFLLDQISKQHYVYKSKPLPGTLIGRAQELKKEIPQFSDERMILELQRLISFVGDGHSYVLPAGASRVQSTSLPLRLYLFRDGLFVIDAPKGDEQWIGSRVARLGNLSAADAMTRIGALISQDNTMGTQWIGPILLAFRGGLEAVGVEAVSGRVSVTLVEPNGRVTQPSFDLTVAPRMHGLPKLIASRLPNSGAPPLYLQNVSSNFWLKELPEQQSTYFQFNQVWDDPSERLGDFARRLEQSLEAKPPRCLIIDVRHNNGGNADLLQPLLDALKKFESSNPRSKIVVITGRNTFSAAQIFINLLNRETKAIFAGEPSSSKPNFVGEENQIVFPWSGAMGSISNRYHESMPGDTRSWIEPEIKLQLLSRDYFANRDPVLDEVLRRYGSVN